MALSAKAISLQRTRQKPTSVPTAQIKPSGTPPSFIKGVGRPAGDKPRNGVRSSERRHLSSAHRGAPSPP